MKKIVSLFCILILLVGILGAFSVNASSTMEAFQASGIEFLGANGNGFMRDISAVDLVKEIRIGWNLGNTLDAPTETAWGNPRTTKAMIDKVKEMGFNAVRVPVTWNTHIGPAPNYTIDQTWLNRVEEVVNYVLDNNMYAILNVHHDDWIIPTYANEAQCKDKLTKLWQQIANHFRDYSDYLILKQ